MGGNWENPIDPGVIQQIRGKMERKWNPGKLQENPGNGGKMQGEILGKSRGKFKENSGKIQGKCKENPALLFPGFPPSFSHSVCPGVNQ